MRSWAPTLLLLALPAAAVESRVEKVPPLVRPAGAASGAASAVHPPLVLPAATIALPHPAVPTLSARFLHETVHDARVPVTAIELSLDRIGKSAAGDARVAEALKQAHAVAHQLAGRLGDLLSEAKVDGRLERAVPVEQVDAVGAELEAHARALGDSVARVAELAGPPADERAATSLSIVRASVRRLGVQLAEMRASARQAGESPVLEQPFGAADALEEAAAAFRAQAEARGVRLVAAPEPGLPPIVGDRERTRRALENLVSNALKHAPAGSAVTLGARRGVSTRKDMLLLSVGDQGPGIPRERQSEIWEPLAQVGTAEANAQGAGLGLAMVRRFAMQQGGEAWVESDPGEGALFYLALPAEPPTVPAEFFHQAVHDLRSPLNALVSGLSLIATSDPGAAGVVRARAQTALEEARAMDGDIKRVLDGASAAVRRGEDGARVPVEAVDRITSGLSSRLVLLRGVVPGLDHPSLGKLGRAGFGVASRQLEAMERELGRIHVAAHQAGSDAVRLEPVAPAELIARAIDAASSAGAVLQADDAGGLGPVLADKGLATRALVNLLSNAVKFGPPGAPVRVSAAPRRYKERDYVEFAVSDRGPGVPRGDRERIFQPFEQSGDAASRGKGNGLGLASVRRAMELQGGEVWLERSALDGPERGSTFVLLLPRAGR